jgi:hypothetical protein
LKLFDQLLIKLDGNFENKFSREMWQILMPRNIKTVFQNITLGGLNGHIILIHTNANDHTFTKPQTL